MVQSDIQWFIAREGQQHGPVSDTEMKKLAELGHLRPSDLVWRQGFADWRPAVAVFPAQPAAAPPFQYQPPQPTAPAARQQDQQPGAGRIAGVQRPANIDRTADPRRGPLAAAQPTQAHAAGSAQRPASRDDAMQPFEAEEIPKRGKLKLVVILSVVLALLGGGVWFITKVRGNPAAVPLIAKPANETSATAAVAAPQAAAKSAPKPSNTNKPLDARLQKLASWQLVKHDFPEWYEERLKEAEGLSSTGKTESDLDKHLVGELVKLRQKNARDALSAPAGNLKSMASAFLDNLKALETYGVPACYAFISKGENTGVVVEMLQSPETGKHVNAQVVAVFQAIAAGKKAPVKRESPQKGDYDVLAAELGRLGWTQADMQLFADPRSLAAARPERVCQMVQQWFTAHLAVSDASIQERLLYETLKPVVGG